MNSKYNIKPTPLNLSLVLIVVCILVYLNSIPNGFVWDDRINITENPTISDLSYVPKIFMQSYGISEKSTYYRPLFPTTYYLEYPIWKNHAWGYRLTNIILHILVTLLIFRIGLVILPNKFSAFLGGLIYAIHPVHVECVTWVSGRVDLLCGLGFFLSFYLYLKYRKDEYHNILLFVGSLFAFFLGLLSKEMAITLPLVVLLYDYTFPPQPKENYPWEKRIPAYMGFFLIIVIYFIFRRHAIGSTLGVDFSQSSLTIRIFTIIGVLLDYVRLLFFPFYLNADYITPPVEHITDMRFIVPLIILISILYLLFTSKKKYPLIFFSGIWIFVTLLPVSNLFPVRDELRIQAERFLYIPSAGFCFLIPVLIGVLQSLTSFSKGKFSRCLQGKTLIFLLSLLISFYAVRTIVRNLDWKNDATFFTKLTIDSPYSFRGFVELGNIEFRKHDMDSAITYYKQALARDTKRASIYTNLANAYAMKREFGTATDYLILAQKLSPYDPQIVSNLAFYQIQLKNYDTALQCLNLILDLTPNNYFNFYLLGQAYEGKGMYPEAISAYQKCLSINPNYTDCQNRLDKLLNSTKNIKE